MKSYNWRDGSSSRHGANGKPCRLRASRTRTFMTVTLPLLKPGLANAFLVGFIESIADFGNPIIVGGQYAVLSTDIFFAIVGAQYDQGRAASLALVLTGFALAVFFLQQRVLGVFGLDQHLARPFGPARAPGHLHDRLRQSFGRAEVGPEQALVCVQHDDQRHQREVMPLGQHLRAHQQFHFAAVDA